MPNPITVDALILRAAELWPCGFPHRATSASKYDCAVYLPSPYGPALFGGQRALTSAMLWLTQHHADSALCVDFYEISHPWGLTAHSKPIMSLSRMGALPGTPSPNLLDDPQEEWIACAAAIAQALIDEKVVTACVDDVDWLH